jgi:hypothetical protein
MTPTEQLKLDLERAQWTTAVCSLLTVLTSTALTGWHWWPLLIVPMVFLFFTLRWGARTVRLRRELKQLA